jgi:putative spermidine/putrescine transport system ATP-binding protein
MTNSRASSGVDVALSGLSRRFDDTVAVSDLSLRLSAGSFTALLGPSGCGKSTTLSMIAGLSTPDGGEITIDGTPMSNVPAEHRPVGMVFQRPLLFPHLNVEQNVAFGLRMRRLRKSEIRSRVASMLERVQLGGLAGRRVGELSGGQEQRVALARALVLEPPVLLLDEPFSQLDASLRHEMRSLVRRLHDESKVTTVFVTHDQSEAVEVADSIALMLAGQLVAFDTPTAFYTRPPSLAAARFFGFANDIAGEVSAGYFVSHDGCIEIPSDAADGAATLVVRPESLWLLPTGTRAPVGAAGTVVNARFAGSHLEITVQRVSGEALTVHTPIDQAVQLGSPVVVGFRAGGCTVIPGRSS